MRGSLESIRNRCHTARRSLRGKSSPGRNAHILGVVGFVETAHRRSLESIRLIAFGPFADRVPYSELRISEVNARNQVFAKLTKPGTRPFGVVEDSPPLTRNLTRKVDGLGAPNCATKCGFRAECERPDALRLRYGWRWDSIDLLTWPDSLDATLSEIVRVVRG
jgi:hypothetical protein